MHHEQSVNDRALMTQEPPFQLTHAMLSRVADIAERVGAWNAANPAALVPQLRRGNRIRSIQASLAIEQNTLSIEQVTAVLAGRYSEHRARSGRSSTPSPLTNPCRNGNRRASMTC